MDNFDFASVMVDDVGESECCYVGSLCVTFSLVLSFCR
jgi:hypothetical protein